MAATVAVFVFPTPAPPDSIKSKFYPILSIALFCETLVWYPGYPLQLVLQLSVNFSEDFIYYLVIR